LDRLHYQLRLVGGAELGSQILGFGWSGTGLFTSVLSLDLDWLKAGLELDYFTSVIYSGSGLDLA